MTDFLADDYLFVYGSLRKAAGRSEHGEMCRYCHWVGNGFIQAVLYRIDHYPGAVASNLDSDRVWGEIYRISDHNRLFACLDHYEECSAAFAEPHEYRRQQLTVTHNNGDRLPAWVYLFNHSIADKPRILSGDFLDYLNSNTNRSDI